MASNDPNKNGNNGLEDRILHFDEDILSIVNRNFPLLLVAGSSLAGKTSIMRKVGPVRNRELYQPPKFSAHERSDSSRIPLPSEIQDELSKPSDQIDMDKLTELASHRMFGLSYTSYGEPVFYARTMYGDTVDKIFNLQVSSPAVVWDLMSRYLQKGMDIVPIMIETSFSHLKSRLDRKSAVDPAYNERERYLRGYEKEFRENRDRFLASFVNRNPTSSSFDDSQIQSQIEGVAGRVEALLNFYLTRWKDYQGDECCAETVVDPAAYNECFQAFKGEFHRYFVNSLLEDLYEMQDISELQEKIADDSNSESFLFTSLAREEIEEIGLRDSVEMDYAQMTSALRNLSPTSIEIDNKNRIILHHDNFKGDPPYKQRLREIFKDVLMRKNGVFSYGYLRTHINGGFAASLTDEAMNTDYAIVFKFV